MVAFYRHVSHIDPQVSCMAPTDDRAGFRQALSETEAPSYPLHYSILFIWGISADL